MFATYRTPIPTPLGPLPGSTPCANRLRHDLRLQQTFRHLHQCGPRPVAHAVAELLDDLGADPHCLDGLLRWRALDPGLVRAFGGDDFPRPPLRLVPPL